MQNTIRPTFTCARVQDKVSSNKLPQINTVGAWNKNIPGLGRIPLPFFVMFLGKGWNPYVLSFSVCVICPTRDFPKGKNVKGTPGSG